MTSERDQVRGSVVEKDSADAELQAAIGNAHQLQHSLDKEKETNRHREAKYDKWISAVPYIIAALAVIFGFAVFFLSMYFSSHAPEQGEFWAKQGERGIGVATAALAYIFGKASN